MRRPISVLALSKFLPEEIERWGKVIRAAGISAG